MRYTDEFRQPEAVTALAAQIRAASRRPAQLMPRPNVFFGEVSIKPAQYSRAVEVDAG